MFAAIGVGTIVAVYGCHDCECVSFLISILVRFLAACTMRTFFLYLGSFLLWCCQFGVVILQYMGIDDRQDNTSRTVHTLGCCNDSLHTSLLVLDYTLYPCQPRP